MARRRVIDPEFWLDEELAHISPHARLLYIGLWAICDDNHATLPNRPDWIKAQLLPYESVTIPLLLEELASLSKIILFRVDEKEFWYIKNFFKHQRVEKPSKPKYPRFEANLSILPDYSPTTPRLVVPQVKRSKEKLSIANGEKSPSAPINPLFELFEPVNPSYRELYKNKTQRGALERMVKTHGEDPVKHWIGIICKTNGMPYAPVITTPFEMEKKLGDLKAFITREKSKQQ